MRRRVMVLVLSVLLSLWVAPVALAADGEQGGKNVGHLLGNWAHSLFVGVAGLVAVVLLISRKHTELAAFVVMAIVVGGFVMAPGDVTGMIRGIWHTVTQ